MFGYCLIISFFAISKASLIIDLTCDEFSFNLYIIALPTILVNYVLSFQSVDYILDNV